MRATATARKRWFGKFFAEVEKQFLDAIFSRACARSYAGQSCLYVTFSETVTDFVTVRVPSLANDLIYRRLAPGLLRRLKEKRAELGKPGNKLHSWLSQDTGYPEVILHLGKVVGLMMLSGDYGAFRAELNKIAPLYPGNSGTVRLPQGMGVSRFLEQQVKGVNG